MALWRRTATALAVAVTVVGPLGCTGGSGPAGTTTPNDANLPTVTVAASPLPPGTLSELAPVIDPLVAPLGLRLTRAALVDRSAGAGARPGDTRFHLAMYVEPLARWDEARFVATITPLAQVLTPFVFARWPALESYDVCQEPSPGVDDRADPAPVTAFETNRAYSDRTGWAAASLGRIVRDARDPAAEVFLQVASELASELLRATNAS